MKNRSIHVRSVDTNGDATTTEDVANGSRRKIQSRLRRIPVHVKTPALANSSSSIKKLSSEIERLQGLLRQDKLERVNQLRRCILYHSCLYYKFGTSVIEDSLWDSWAKELVELQKDKKLKKSGWNPHLFADWTGESGFQLPLDEDWVKNKALQILKLFKDE